MVKKKEVAKPKCHKHCLCSVIAKAVGTWLIVVGFLLQMGNLWGWRSLLLYLAGFILYKISHKLSLCSMS